MRVLVVALVLCASTFSANAQQTQMERAERISRAIGLDQQLASVQEANLAGVREQASVALAQLTKAGIPESHVAQLKPAVERLLAACASSWDPKIAARIYAEGLVDVLSEAELQEAEAYYSSPAGAKANAALAESQSRMLQYIQGASAKAVDPAMEAFLAEVKRAATSAKAK